MKTAAVAVEAKEETMKVLTISELLNLTKIELLELAGSLATQLQELPAGSSEHQDTLKSLENVRAVLARPEFSRRSNARAAPAP